jgi:hypothetical protein
MGYYTRVLTPTARGVSVEELRAILKAEALKASLEVEDGPANDWTGLVLAHQSGPEIAVIDRSPVGPGTLGKEEIEEFLEEIADCKPLSAAKWLSDYLPKVNTVYAFQWLHGTKVENGWEILRSLMIGLHKSVGGVLQADGEGFSDDEQGDHILWQFSEDVKGPWRMAVLRNGKWVRFEMQLGNQKHRDAFLRGEIPAGVRVLE